MSPATGLCVTRAAPRLVGLVLLLLLLAASCGRPRVPSARGFDVVLVTVDTVRADRLGCYGGGVETPAMDRIAREGTRFEQAVTAAPLTLPSHATILSGLLPPHHGLRNNGAGRLPDRVETLATRLTAAGYRTGAFVGAFVLDHRFGLSRGFSVYDDEIDRGDASGGDALEAERPGSVVVDRALAWLASGRGDAPYFLWVHLYDAHAPYDPPEPFRTRYHDRLYDGEVAGVDAQVGRILDAIDRRGSAARTVVIVAGDHGESLGEHGEQTHGLLLYEPTLRVPLIARAPGVIAPHGVVREPVSLADVTPTLLALLGVPSGEAPLDGRSLVASLAGGASPARAEIYSETEYPRLFGWSGLAALRTGATKYIHAPRPELYDLAADPGETVNRIGSQTAAARGLEDSLARYRDAATEVASVDDAETQARLLSLGYAAGPASSRGERDPKDAVALFARFEAAHRALNAGRADEAAEELDRLMHEDPRNPVFRGVLAQAEQRRGHLDRAITLHREEVALRPDDTAARYELGLALQQAGRTAEATAALEDAIRRDARFPEAHNALGIALAAQGRAEDALAEFQRAVDLDPRASRAHHNRGNVLRDLGRLDDAAREYERALAIDPRYADPHTGLGAIALTKGDASLALAEFDRALALAPGEHDLLVNRGIALEMLGRYEDARSAYRRFLAVAGGASEYASTRAAARELLARLDAAPGSRPSHPN